MSHPSPAPSPGHAPSAAHDDFGGFERDRLAIVGRRRALAWMGGIGLGGVLAACSSGDATSSTATTSSPATTSSVATTSTASPTTDASASTSPSSAPAGSAVEASAGAEIPDETAGPYPADGSNGPNVLGTDGIERADLTTSFGELSGTAEGVATTINLTVVDASTGDPIPGAAVYLWHCTAAGQYSIYEVTDQNYLRGIASADDAGRVAFTTIFPGCYRGRWPHCHFEVYPSMAEATSGASAIKTSQLALAQADCETVYADARYGESLANLGQLSLSSDQVFRDGWDDQLATATGSAADGYAVSLLVRV